MSQSSKTIINSALPYVNNVPHLGNIIGSSLSADVFARYCRAISQPVLFVCGTDEYGTTAEIRAAIEGLEPQELCDKYYQKHKEIYEWFELSFDVFGRTTTPTHTRLSQDLFTALYRQGYLLEQTRKQQYCEPCQRFLADRFVEGTCPHCSYGDARGDQCDKCQRLLEPEQLVEPRCKICRKAPVLKSSDHLFLDLPRLQDKLIPWIDSAAPGWSRNAGAITSAWIKQGLEPRCITRDLKWGVPVPIVDPALEKFRGKVLYSWFEAPMGYVSITACHLPETWQEWWHDPTTKLVQFMGKDNVPFHTIVFPSALIGSGQPEILVSHLAATEYLNYEDGKFSKSRSVGVFGNDCIQSGLPPEIWRYYLISVRPESSDSTFSWKDLQAKVNGELNCKLGNLVQRILAFVSKNYTGVVPKCGERTVADQTLIQEVDRELVAYHVAMAAINLREALGHVMSVATLANGYLSNEKPWASIKTEPSRAATVCHVGVNLVRLLADLIEPVMPSIRRRMYVLLGLSPVAQVTIPRKFELVLPEGWEIRANPVPLFQMITNEQVEEFRKKYSGSGS
jgi:methionyl-tRNA synthetase